MGNSWTDIATAVGTCVGASGAVAAAFATIKQLRDQARRLEQVEMETRENAARAQAALIAVTAEPGDEWGDGTQGYTTTVTNRSDHPVYDVVVRIDGRSAAYQGIEWPETPEVAAGASWESNRRLIGSSDAPLEPIVSFTDANGRRWQKDAHGNLSPADETGHTPAEGLTGDLTPHDE